MLALQALVFQRRHVFEAAALLGDQRIGGAVIGIGTLNQVVALREAHDDVATMGPKRHPDEAGRLREVHIVQLLVQLLGEQFGKLILESLALFVGERQVMRIGANAQHLGIDELDRQIAGFLDLRACAIAPEEHSEDRQYCDRQPAPLSGICHRKLLHFRPTMVANFRKISATSTNEGPLKPQMSKMLCSPIGPRNRNNPGSARVACAATQTWPRRSVELPIARRGETEAEIWLMPHGSL